MLIILIFLLQIDKMVSTVLITGSSQGIGRSSAKLFASKGYDVILAARTLEGLRSVAEEIEALAIVNVGSFGGKMPLPNMTAYCTSKYAVTGLTETLRLELEPKGIQVCGVHPSVTNSDFLSRAVFRSGNETEEDTMRQQMREMLKSPLASQPEDVAKAIWEVAQHPSPSVIVGSGAMMAAIYSWFPGLTQWLMQRGTKGQG
jgi:short-subunit dehydrogenase